MLTVWCLAVAFATPLIAGAPLVWLARRGRVLRPTDWLWVPFVGLTAIIYVVQNLIVFADWPIRRTAPWLWAGIGLLWVAMLAVRSGRASLRRFPVRVAMLMLAIGSVLSIGVWVQGIERYRGNLLSDQYMYVVLAQFLMDEPYSTDCSAAREHPWLAHAIVLKEDRLGQSVLHGFFAVTADRDAFDLFFPTQLLGPVLLCPAVLLLAKQFRLSRRVALWTATAAALAPGTELLQSFCYLSQALCVPAMVAFLAAVIRLSRGGSYGPLPYAAVAFGLGLAVYTEFTPLMCGSGAAALGVGWLGRWISLRRSVAVLAALLVAACANPAVAFIATKVYARGTTVGTRMTLPSSAQAWATGLWVNSDDAMLHVFGKGFSGPAAIALSCFLASAVGWVVLAARVIRRPSLCPAAAAIGSLFIPPAILWAARPDSVYMIAKLIWTLTPFCVVFLACAYQEFGFAQRWQARRIFASAICWGLVLIFVYQDFIEQRNYLGSNKSRTEPAGIWNGSDLQRVCGELHRHPRAEVVVALDAEPKPDIASGAMCFYGRHHRIRLLAPDLIWGVKLQEIPGYGPPDLGAVEPGVLIVQRVQTPRLTGTKVEVLAQFGQYELLCVRESQEVRARDHSPLAQRNRE
jgi:hypothetical protein